LVTLSTESVLAGLGALIGCITFLFKMLQSAQQREIQSINNGCALLVKAKDETIQEKDETIAWLKQELRLALRTTERATTAAETATTVAKNASEP